MTLPAPRVPPKAVLDKITKYLNYSPTTGCIRWQNCTAPMRRRVQDGDEAGWISTDGYRVVTVYCPDTGARYNLSSHHIAIYLCDGVYPDYQVDHRNRVKLDNRRSNLRRANAAINRYNRKLNTNSTSGVRGVASLASGRFSADITFLGRFYHLGVFDDVETAKAIRVVGEKLLFGRVCPSNRRR